MSDRFRTLAAFEELDVYDRLFSTTRAFMLTMQPDGNLVLYVIDDTSLPLDTTQSNYRKALWATDTDGTDAVRAVMLDDGNFVLYNRGSDPRWMSNTAGNPGAILLCQNDGNLVIYSPDGTAIWSSNTYAGPR